MPCGCTGEAPIFEDCKAGAIRARHIQRHVQDPLFIHVRLSHRKSHQMRACAPPSEARIRNSECTRKSAGQAMGRSPSSPQPPFCCSEQQQWNSVNVWVILVADTTIAGRLARFGTSPSPLKNQDPCARLQLWQSGKTVCVLVIRREYWWSGETIMYTTCSAVSRVQQQKLRCPCWGGVCGCIQHATRVPQSHHAPHRTL